jgi:hypothetical protein
MQLVSALGMAVSVVDALAMARRILSASLILEFSTNQKMLVH